ncbi:helicase, partial [Mycobacterium sp. ITM-2017-0098]
NDARTTFVDVITWALTERAIAKIGRGWLTRDDKAAWEHLRADLLDELEDHRAFTNALNQLWPVLTPETLLAELYSSHDRLRAAGADPVLWRADGDAWTVSDVPLLDELVDLLGRDKSGDEAAERERQEEAAYAAGVLDLMIGREDLMDDEDQLMAQDVIAAEDLA